MRVYLLILLFSFGGVQVIKASDLLKLTSDTVKIDKFELPDEKEQTDQPLLHYNINILTTGLYINKTFGVHPLLNFSIDKLNGKNTYKLVYETKFGSSKNKYQILDNDTLKTTNAFGAQYVGLEYERMLFSHPYQELFLNGGFGYDWIRVGKKDSIRNVHFLGGMAFNVGFTYCLYIRKKHGPQIGLFYQITDFNNKNGSELSNNAVIIRLSYHFARLPARLK